jgi:hypothetical protein
MTPTARYTHRTGSAPCPAAATTRPGEALSTPAPTPKRPRKPTLPKLIEKYYADLRELARQHVMYEMGVRPAFHALLAAAGRDHGWTLIAEHEKKVNGRTIRPDGTFKDAMNLVRGYWEAKDTSDKLDAEIERKRKARAKNELRGRGRAETSGVARFCVLRG